MTTNQEGVHAAVRAETSTTGTYLEDWHALFTADAIAAGPWNARMIAWVNQTLSTSYTSLNDAMNAFAIDQGFSGWTDMNTFSVSAWSPQDLFTAGVDGGWYEISDLSTLFAERTGGGTTPASVDGVVGTCRDKSGLDRHLVAPSDAARPILRLSGGVYHLEFDGVDDTMASASTFTMTSPVFAGVCLTRASAASHGVAQFGFYQSVNNYAAVSANASSEALMQARASAGTALSLATTSTQFANGTTRVLLGRVNTSDGYIQVDSNTEITSSYAGYASPGTAGFVVANRNIAVAGKFHGMIAVVNKSMSADDLNNARTWLGTRGGLTL